MKMILASVFTTVLIVAMTLGAMFVLVQATEYVTSLDSPLQRAVAMGAELLLGVVLLLGTVWLATHLAEIYGTKASASWNQERPDELWIGHRNGGNEVVLKDPSLLAPAAAAYADLPGGHSEGYDDTFKQLFRRFYQSIPEDGVAAEYPQFAAGLRQMRVLDAVLASHRGRAWVDVAAD